ncbi:MAG: hypothetical protein ACXWDN_21665, partial [Limisphaerales bacterium]
MKSTRLHASNNHERWKLLPHVTTRLKIIFGGSALAFAIGLALFIIAEQNLGPEPTYHQKSLRYWVTALADPNQYVTHQEPEAVGAIKQIGPAAVPFLLDWMPKPKRNPTTFERLLSRIPFIA